MVQTIIHVINTYIDCHVYTVTSQYINILATIDLFGAIGGIGSAYQPTQWIVPTGRLIYPAYI